MESPPASPVKFGFGETPINDQDTKKKEKDGKAKKTPPKLSVGALFNDTVEKRSQGISILSRAEESLVVKPKPSKLEVKPAEDVPKTEINPAAETRDQTTEPLEDSKEQTVAVEPKTELETEDELQLPDSDEAWERANRNNQNTEVVETVKTESWQAEEFTEVEVKADRRTKTSKKSLAIEQDQLLEVQPALSKDVLVADGEFHALPKGAERLHQRLDLEPKTIIIEHQIKSTELTEEITPLAEASPQLTPESDEPPAAAPEPVAETTLDRGGNIVPPLPPEETVLLAEPTPEPERPAPPNRDHSEAYSVSRLQVTEQYSITAKEAEPINIPSRPTAAPEIKVVERQTEVAKTARPGHYFEWLDRRRVGKEIRRGQRQQKKQIKQFAHQQSLANQQFIAQFTEQQALAENTQTKLVTRLDTIKKLITRPEKASKPYPDRSLPNKFRLPPRPTPASIENQPITVNTASPEMKPKPKPRLNLLKPFRLPPRPTPASIENQPITVNTVSPEMKPKPKPRLNLLKPIRRPPHLTPSPGEKYAAALERAAIQLKGRPEKQTSLFSPSAPEKTGTQIPVEKYVATQKPEVSPHKVQSAVAETAIEQVLQLPPDHHLQKSAWHSIEVDKSGRAVEQPVFAYGHEFLREQRQEARSYKAPITAAQTGVLIVSDNDGGNQVSLGRRPARATNSSQDTSRIPVEAKASKPRPLQLKNVDQDLWLLVTIVIILLAITGLILVHSIK